MRTIDTYSEAHIKDICYNCGSAMAKRSYNYFRRLLFVSRKVWVRCWYDGGLPVAFYIANRCRDHVRLIEIAVRDTYQGRGLGRQVLFDLLSRMKADGVFRLTLRTPSTETAYGFWLHIGARIVDVKEGDYVMGMTIK